MFAAPARSSPAPSSADTCAECARSCLYSRCLGLSIYFLVTLRILERCHAAACSNVRRRCKTTKAGALLATGMMLHHGTPDGAGSHGTMAS